MRWNPNDDRDRGRLFEAIRYSRRRLNTLRTERVGAIRQYVGQHYSERGSSETVPINLLEQAVHTYRSLLVSSRPRALVTTTVPELKASMSLLELAVNVLLEQIRIERVLKRAVIEALFSVAFTKTGLVRRQQVEVDGVLHDIGQVNVDLVDLDDWVHDMRAKTWEQVTFMGNRYRLPLDYVKESGLYENTEALDATDDTSQSEEGVELAATISRGTDSMQAGEFVPLIDLWDLWLPLAGREPLVVTIRGDGTGKPLSVREWEGPEEGLYRMLSFSDVPGQILPLAPVALWRDLHDLANVLYRKLGDQAKRQKTILGIQAPAKDDGQRIVEANDGEAIRMDNPGGAQDYKFGGVDAQTLAFAIHVLDQFSRGAGNLDALGGLSAMSETVGQDRMLRESASQRIVEMRSALADFTRSTVRDLAWYLWTDPLVQLPMTKRVPGTDIEIPVTFDPSVREGEFFDYTISIVPYSLHEPTPADRLETISQFFARFVEPYVPLLEAQGIAINFEALFKTVAKYSHIPELEDLFQFQAPMIDSAMPGRQAMQAIQSRRSNRTYTRVNRPGGTQGGRNAAMIQSLLGKGLQEAQGAAMVGGA